MTGIRRHRHQSLAAPRDSQSRMPAAEAEAETAPSSQSLGKTTFAAPLESLHAWQTFQAWGLGVAV